VKRDLTLGGRGGFGGSGALQFGPIAGRPVPGYLATLVRGDRNRVDFSAFVTG